LRPRATYLMPSRPKRVCNHPGCSKLVTLGYCDEHRKLRQQLQDKVRGSAHSRGYTSRWQRESKQHLNEHPLCIVCLACGRTEAATVVDHIIPHKGNRELFWDKSNWQSLCKRHHDIKTATEDGAFGRRG
jgi:5-methylcytosine-specific restriction protein A